MACDTFFPWLPLLLFTIFVVLCGFTLRISASPTGRAHVRVVVGSEFGVKMLHDPLDLGLKKYMCGFICWWFTCSLCCVVVWYIGTCNS